MSRIPDGWEYWTTEKTAEEGWRVGVEYKQMRERVQNGTFVRIKVIPADGAYWILRRIEHRPLTHRPAA